MSDSQQDSSNKPESQALTFDHVLDVLEHGKVSVEHGTIRWSSNYTFLISIEHEDTEIMAIYKPQRGERPLWDFPDGTLCYRERASFVTATELGWKIIPPTVLRDGPRGLGSMQFYVEHDPDYNYFSFPDSLQPQLLRLSLLDVLINNADRKGGHCLVDGQGLLWGIDHGLTFNTSHKLRTVIWDFADQPIATQLLKDIGELCEKIDDPKHPFYSKLSKLISPSEFKSFQRRVRGALKTGKFPVPGPGPNYPWPPV